jgi:hypothetical protein
MVKGCRRSVEVGEGIEVADAPFGMAQQANATDHCDALSPRVLVCLSGRCL